MEKEALEYAVGLAEPHIEEIDGKVYSDKILTNCLQSQS